MFEAHTQVLLFKIILLVIVIITVIFLLLFPAKRRKITSSKLFLCSLTLFCICFIGIREWWVEEVYSDSIRYGQSYLILSNHLTLNIKDAKDVGFSVFSWLCAQLSLSINTYFILCACLYVIPLMLFSCRITRIHSVVLFIMIITSLSFYNYGVNGIRNGIATSLLLWSITYFPRKMPFLILSILAVIFHKSVLIPLVSFLIVCHFSKTKWYVFAWVCAIPLSFYIFQAFSDFLLRFTFIADRAEDYLTGSIEGEFSRVGFRYDFLLYGAVPIIVGYYFLYKKHFEDQFYERLFNCYVLTNTFWVLINQVPYSNRFAYLSWFMMPILIIYPFIYYPSIQNRYLHISTFLLGYYAFTFII